MGSSPTTKKPKSGNRNSEKRRERSKVAARCRRGKESEIFGELGLCMPISDTTRSTLDKASIMRLSLCHLKLREIVEKDFHCGSITDEEASSKYDSLLTDALGGFVFVLTMEGDVVYLSTGVTTYLGLSEVELMKCSIYEFTHPEDHKEIKEALAINKRDSDDKYHAIRSVSCRMKCTITSRGRNHHIRGATTYKVINFRGRIFGNPKDTSSRWFGGIAEVLPHPSDVDIPLNKQTFLSKHSLDFKFEQVDDSINGFLGYQPEDLLGKSFFEFINFSKEEMNPLVKVFSSLHSQGQAITEIYRFLAKYGGWVWVRTVATVLYANNGTVPTSIVCLHFIASGIENSDQILSNVQNPIKPDSDVLCNSNSNIVKEIEKVKEVQVEDEDEPSADKENNMQEINVPIMNNPIASTRKVFTRKTEDMDKGFLIPFDNTMIESKEDQEDLTHLAPMAGDECVQLGPPMLDDLLETLDQAEIEYTFDGLIVDVNADDLPPLCGAPSAVIRIVNSADAESEKVPLSSVSASSTTSPLFLNLDPHMTMSPDSKSLLSPFQNSNIPHECDSNLCDLNTYNAAFPVDSKSSHSQLNVPTVVEKSKYHNFFHKDASELEPFDLHVHEDAWSPIVHNANLSEKSSPVSPYFTPNLLEYRASVIHASADNFDAHVKPYSKAAHEKTLVQPFTNSVKQSNTLSPSMCSSTVTGFNHTSNDASPISTLQNGYLIDGDPKWKTKGFGMEDKVGHCKLMQVKAKGGSESEYAMNPVLHTKSRFIPPEVSRKKVIADFAISTDVKITEERDKNLSSLAKDIFLNGTQTEALTINGEKVETAVSISHKRRKLLGEAEEVPNLVNIPDKRTNGQLYYSVDEIESSKSKRKRSILGRLLCCSSSSGKLSLCELTRQDYEVNAPLGDNCCLLQGPDILNALEAENFPDSIL